jgi:hypothetical protein
LQAFGTVFAYRDCVNPLITGFLPYTGFTFNKPNSLYIEDTRLSSYTCVYPDIYRIDSRVSRLHNFPTYRHFAVYPNSLSKCPNISLIYCISICACTVSAPVQYLILRVCQLYKIDSRVSRLRNFLLTGNLPYNGFTFEVLEHQSYIYFYIYLRVYSISRFN